MIGKVIGISKTIANDLNTTEEGYVLGARQGKVLNDKITELQANKFDATQGEVLNDKITGLAQFFGGNTVATAKSISASPSEKYSYTFTVSTDFSCGGVTVPQYSKGIYISNGGGDGVLIAVDTDGNVITAFRSSGTWESGKSR